MFSVKVKKSYQQNDSLHGVVAIFRFFSTHVEISGKSLNQIDTLSQVVKMTYQFDKALETKTNFYLINSAKTGAIFFLIKANCSAELIDFIRKKMILEH